MYINLIPQIVGIFDNGMYPNELKKTITGPIIEGMEDIGANQEMLDILIEILHEMIDFVWLQNNSGYPVETIQRQFSNKCMR